MRLAVRGLRDLRERLGAADVQTVAVQALAAGADRVAEAVRQGLAASPGEGDHDRPWRRSGALQDSIGVTVDGLAAVVGSDDPAAAPQELGTALLPPRPFLAPAAAGMGRAVAAEIATAVTLGVRGDTA